MKNQIKLLPGDLEFDPETKRVTVSKRGYAVLLYHGHYDPKQPMAYLDFVRRTGNKSKTSRAS